MGSGDVATNDREVDTENVGGRRRTTVGHRMLAALAAAAGTGLAVVVALLTTAAPASANALKAPAMQFPWPDNGGHRITGSGYNCGHHVGLDYYALDFDFATNSPVTAIAAGRAYRGSQTEGGNFIYIDHGNGFVSTYFHLSSWVATSGQYVNQGQLIAYSGNTGTWTTGAHLHFAVHQNATTESNGSAYRPEPMYGPYRGGNGGFGSYGACAGGASPVYTSKPGCPSGSSTTVFGRATKEGYYQVAQDGGVFAFGGAPFSGSMGGQPLNAVMSGFARTYDNNGYWEVGADGGIFAFNAPFNGSAGSLNLVSCIQGMVARPNGSYYMVAADGGIFAYPQGTPFYGSMGGQPLAARIQGMAATPDGGGYWLVGADGGVFAFGNAPFLGSLAGQATAPAMSIASSPTGRGYWILQANGTVVGFGDAANLGSALNPYAPAIGIAPTVNGDGYWISLVDGEVVPKGNARDDGGLYGTINSPTNGVTGLHGQPPDFSMNAVPSTVIVPPGTSSDVTVSTTANPYFQGTVFLSSSGAPSGSSASIAPSAVALNQNQSGTSTLHITRGLSQLGAFTVTVSGCGNGICRSVRVTVN
jgi:murein DD-endopeptidase MepM/ murein hydrolase activator NlpD